jgi:hypothetical protein
MTSSADPSVANQLDMRLSDISVGAPEPVPVFNPMPNEALTVAIGKARVEFLELRKSAKGMIGKRTFNYAPLGDMVAIMEAALAKHGVGFVMPIESDGVQVTCFLIVQGHGGAFRTSMRAKVPTPEDKGRGGFKLEDTWVQELGRITTYLRRYLVNSFFGLDTVEDKDSDGVEERPAFKQRDDKAETPAQHEARKSDAARPGPVKTPPRSAEDLRDALGTARKTLGWDKSQTVEFIRANFNGAGPSSLSEAQQAELLGMMEDLYQAQRASGDLESVSDGN